MKRYSKTIDVYDLKGLFDGFCVEVHDDKDGTEFYLYHKQYGIKEYMYGVAWTCDYCEIEAIIDTNIEASIKNYTDKYITEEIA